MKILTQKQRVLMMVLDEMSRRGIKSRLFMIKSLFLLKKEENVGKAIKFYYFFPYKYGPFSFTSYDDIARLQKNGFLTADMKVTAKGRMEASKVKDMRQKAANTVSRFKSKDEIKNYVYEKYPEYTVKSELSKANNILPGNGIFTIGYEGHDIDSFLDVLVRNGIDTIIDTRFNPFSMNFDFVQSKLARKLSMAGIEYIHIKPLGIDGNDRKALESKKDYERLFASYRSRIQKENAGELGRIVSIARKKRVALLCFEKDKNMCHRGIISEELEKTGLKVAHL